MRSNKDNLVDLIKADWEASRRTLDASINSPFPFFPSTSQVTPQYPLRLTPQPSTEPAASFPSKPEEDV
jgi:hypothetical protein